MTLFAHITRETSDAITMIFVGGAACGVVTVVATVVLIFWLVKRRNKDDK